MRAQSSLAEAQSHSKPHIQINSCSPVFPTHRAHTGASSWSPALSAGSHHAWTSSYSSKLKKHQDSPTKKPQDPQQQFFGECLSMAVLPCKVNQSMPVLSEEQQGRANGTKAQCSSRLSVGRVHTPSSQVLHLCLRQQNILSRVCSSKPSLVIADFPKKLEVSTSGL